MSQAGCLIDKRILCVRPDNMGDLLMSSPAFAALKETFNAHITVLTSSMGAKIVPFIPVIDDVIIADLPWVKNERRESAQFDKCVELLREGKFDAAFIFTVFSQNPLPSAMVCYLAGIPEVYGYCRENPYQLINHWIPDDEPYFAIRHQVTRDLRLVAEAGAQTGDQHIRIRPLPDPGIHSKLYAKGVPPGKAFIILHPGVSEEKRQYPLQKWVEICREMNRRYGHQILFTGVASERPLVQQIIDIVGTDRCVNLAGDLSLNEFILLIAYASFVISVNTSTSHIAAGLQTPVVVLYAATNPQHTPWMVPNKVLYFEVNDNLRSKNEVLRYVTEQSMQDYRGYPSTNAILEACDSLVQPISVG